VFAKNGGPVGEVAADLLAIEATQLEELADVVEQLRD
jgi:hypothetical protein